ncbi:MAG: hypothetical protein JSR77_10720 [Planctomycetes bacterium]|nr:hypothetical protein [Planctomycetota bacterium]
MSTPKTKPAAQSKRAPLRARGRLDARGWGIVAALIVIPVVIAACKVCGVEFLRWAVQWCSFEPLPHEMRHRTLHLLFAPVGALVVVFTRLTLGIRVLGPFRSVLLAIAFQVTGPVVGLAFFALVLFIVVWLRPIIKSMRMPFFGRSAAMLAAVSVTIVLTILVGLAFGLNDVERVAYFPIVVLTLAGEAFSSTIRKEGLHSALWRAGATAVTALVITAISSVPPLQDGLILFPESVLLVLACIVLVCEFLQLRAFQYLNPKPQRPKKARKALDAAPVSGAGPRGS